MKELLASSGIQSRRSSPGSYYGIVGAVPEWYATLSQRDSLKKNRTFIPSITTILLQRYKKLAYKRQVDGKVTERRVWVEPDGPPREVVICGDSRATIFKERAGFFVSNVLDTKTGKKIQLTGKPRTGEGQIDLFIKPYGVT